MEIELKYLVEEPIAREKILKDSHLSEIKEKGRLVLQSTAFCHTS